MIPAFSRSFLVAATLAFAVLLTPSAHALEHVTLRNGFTLECARHEAVGDKVRFYTSGDDTSYQELGAGQVASIETLPEALTPASKAIAAASAVSAEPTLDELRHLMEHAGAAHDIDVELLASVIKAESAFHVKAISRTGAQGLMQLMPSTAHQLGVEDAFRADQNIAGGTAYLDTLLKLYKDNLALALAAYNAGPGAVARYHGIPPFRETRAYVARVMNEFYRRKRALTATAAVASR